MTLRPLRLLLTAMAWDDSDHRPVIAIDTIWEAGRSTQLTPMASGDPVSQWLDEVLEGLGLDSLHLLGYSYGAWAALNQVLRAPDRLAAVTAIDPPGAITGIPLPAWARMIRLMRGSREESLSSDRQRNLIMRALPRVLGLTRARSRNSATPSSAECRSST